MSKFFATYVISSVELRKNTRKLFARPFWCSFFSEIMLCLTEDHWRIRWKTSIKEMSIKFSDFFSEFSVKNCISEQKLSTEPHFVGQCARQNCWKSFKNVAAARSLQYLRRHMLFKRTRQTRKITVLRLFSTKYWRKRCVCAKPTRKSASTPNLGSGGCFVGQIRKVPEIAFFRRNSPKKSRKQGPTDRTDQKIEFYTKFGICKEFLCKNFFETSAKKDENLQISATFRKN